MKLIYTIIIFIFISNSISAQTFTNSVGGAIPDNGTSLTCFPITVTGVGNINSTTGLKSVCVNITHPFDDDIAIYLEAPDGSQIALSKNNGGSGANYTNTCFTQSAASSITTGTAPFTGNFLPVENLGWFNNNVNANGIWNLCIIDVAAGDIGTLNNWSITFGPSPAPFPVAGCNGNAAASHFCQSATPICNLNGYCGNTSSTYAPPYTWTELENAFCSFIQNNSFLQFVASASTVSLNVNVTNSVSGDGIQMMVYSGGCGSGAVTSYGCNAQMLPGSNTFTATGLTPGNTYYLMIDGFGGDVCDYSITANSGINVFAVTPAAPSICTGNSITLTASGGNGTYNWSPATSLSATTGATVTANPAVTTTYTVTTGAIGSLNCPLTTTVTVTVAAGGIVPTFTALGPICNGATVPTLPTTSNNGITGTWSPSTVSNTTSGTYTFTPNAGQCATTTTMNIVVNANVTPTFTAISPICNGATAPALPTTSNNGITGTWSPAIVSNTTSGTYTFTPIAGQCASTTTMNITVNANVTPTFTALGPICNGAAAPTLPTTSNNGITGTWSPAIVSNTTSGTYTFTPTAGQCASTATMNITVSTTLAPVISCGVSTTSSVSFNWLPVTGATSYTITYTVNGGASQSGGTIAVTTFTLGSLANNDVVVITVTPIGVGCFASSSTTCTASACSSPSASLSSAVGTNIQSVCINTAIANITYVIGGSATGATVTGLPTGVTGTYAAGIFTISGTPTALGTFNYTVTTTGSCTTNVSATGTITVSNPLSPTINCGTATATSVTFNWAAVTGASAYTISYSVNGGAAQSGGSIAALTYTVNGLAAGNSVTITVTPTTGCFNSSSQTCIATTCGTIPTFTAIAPICNGATAPVLPTTSLNGFTGTWSPSVVNNTTTTIYTFTPNVGQCATNTTLTVTVNPIPIVNLGADATLCQDDIVVLDATNVGATYLWQDASSTATYTVTQAGKYYVQVTASGCINSDTVQYQYTLRPVFTLGADLLYCPGLSYILKPNIIDSSSAYQWQDGSINYTYTANQIGIYTLDVTNSCGTTSDTLNITQGFCKVYVPTAFTPNGDGVNDVFQIYGSEITKNFSMNVYNRWGQKVFSSTNPSNGWNGKLNGIKQDNGVYAYFITYNDIVTNKSYTLKGTIMLIR